MTALYYVGFIQEDLVRNLLQECAKMHKFDHPNVLKLSGVCLDGGPAPYIVMPFMVNGSLLSYLKEERTNLVLDLEDDDPDHMVCEMYYAVESHECKMFFRIDQYIEFMG